nr:hypothetical protein [Tanacetum cinerariifolium]
TCTALTRRVEHLEFDKVAQALEITKLKRRVKKLDRRNKVRVLKLKRLQKVGTSQRVETSDETVIDDISNQGRMIAKMNKDADVVLEDDKEVADEAKEVSEDVKRMKLSQLKSKRLTAAPARVAATPSRRRKGVVIRDPEEESTTSIIIPAETKSKDKGKGILDEAIDHVKQKAKEDHVVKRYQVLKRKPQTQAQARKNMMIEEDDNKALKRLNETLAKKVAKRQKLDEEVEELKRHLQIVPNKDDDRGLGGFIKYSCSNLEESKKGIWSSKGQGMEAIGIMWYVDRNVYNHSADFVNKEEVLAHKIHSRLDAKCDVIREILQLDDAEGVVCLPNEEIFAGLAQMGYKKPSTKLTFYKAFFSSQWKFLIHTLLQSLSAKRTSWNEFSTAMASAIQVAQKKFKKAFENADSSSRVELIPFKIKYAIKVVLNFQKEFLVFSSLSRK